MFDRSGLMLIQPDKKLMFRHDKCFATNEYGNAVCNVTLTVKKGKWNIKQ